MPFTKARPISIIQTEPDADTINEILATGALPTLGKAALGPPPVHKGYWATLHMRIGWIDQVVSSTLLEQGAVERAAIEADDAIKDNPELAEAARRIGIHSRIQAALWGLYVGSDV